MNLSGGVDRPDPSLPATRRSTTDPTSAARHILKVDELDLSGGKVFASTRREPSSDGSAIEVRPDGTYAVRYTSFELHHRSLLIAGGSVGAAPSADLRGIIAEVYRRYRDM